MMDVLSRALVTLEHRRLARGERVGNLHAYISLHKHTLFGRRTVAVTKASCERLLLGAGQEGGVREEDDDDDDDTNNTAEHAAVMAVLRDIVQSREV